MSRSSKHTGNQNFKYFRTLLKLELFGHSKFFLFSPLLLLSVLLISVVVLMNAGELSFALYTALYAAIIINAAVSAVIPARRTVIEIRHGACFKESGLLPAAVQPTSKEFTLARFTAAVIFSLASSILYAISDLTVTFLGGHYYDGYLTAFVSNILIFFSVLFYITLVLTASAADYNPKAKHPRRRTVLGGVLLYTLGLVILVTAILCISTLSFGTDSSAESTESEASSSVVLILSALYLAVTLLRSVYLYFITNRRLARALKLMKK